MDTTNKREQWVQRLAAFERSGLSRRAWCSAQGVNVNTLDYWCRRLRVAPATGPRSPALVPIVVRAGMSAPAPTFAPSTPVVTIELEWPNGLRLRTALDANVLELAALVRALSPC
jgi:hypothetical protein